MTMIGESSSSYPTADDGSQGKSVNVLLYFIFVAALAMRAAVGFGVAEMATYAGELRDRAFISSKAPRRKTFGRSIAVQDSTTISCPSTKRRPSSRRRKFTFITNHHPNYRARSLSLRKTNRLNYT